MIGPLPVYHLPFVGFGVCTITGGPERLRRRRATAAGRSETGQTVPPTNTAAEIVCLGHAASVLAEPHLARSKPGFADRLIHAEYLARSGGILSFEKAAKKLPGVTVPS